MTNVERLILLLFVPLAAFPVFVSAAVCDANGSTVLVVNGILSKSEADADRQRKDLEVEFEIQTGRNDVIFLTGYNPSHVAGLSDTLQSITQAFYKPMSTFDRDTILMQLQSKLSTRKILLVGHSQGTYYTNELYQYLITHGVPKESIGVYNIATPASFVAGGGGYVTSTNDKIINLIRSVQVEGNVKAYADSHYTIRHVVDSSLRANITIAPEAGHAENFWGGHKLSVYLDGAAPRIMNDINASLQRLKASGTAADGGCFEPPREDIAYKTKSLVYSLVDPLANGTKTVATSLKGGAEDFTDYVASGVNETKYFAQSLFKTLASTDKKTQAAATTLPNPQISPAPRVVTAAQPMVAAVDSKKIEPTIGQTVVPPSMQSSIPNAVDDPPVERANAPETATDTTSQPTNHTQQFSMSPGFGGGGEAAASTSSAPSANLNISTPLTGVHLATSTVTFSGTADALAEITLTYASVATTTVADGSGAWNTQLQLSEGAAHVKVVAKNSMDAEVEATRDLTIDLTPPAAPSASILHCAGSLVSAFCVVPTTDIRLEWSGDAHEYAVYKDGTFVQRVSATSSAQTISLNATTTLVVVAYDIAGNAATSTGTSVYAVSMPIVINEIGWGGTDTGAASGQQWFELKNVTGWDIDLSNFSVVRSSGETISLVGTSIPANEKLVVEQSDLSIAAGYEVVVGFTDLPTTAAEQLTLVWQGVAIDATPAVGTCPSWCAGNFYVRVGSNVSGVPDVITSHSMERISASTDGTLATNWRTYDGYEARVWGSAGSENSNGLPESGVYCGPIDNLITPGTAYVPFDTNIGNGLCFYLSRFITEGRAHRFATLLQGTVGSSTSLNVTSLLKSSIVGTLHRVNESTPAGTEFFYVIYETPPSISGVTTLFTNYFQFGEDPANGGNPPPHGNYVTIPFTYQP